MESFHIELGPGRIHTVILGAGPDLVVGFHGFGESSSRFQALADALHGFCKIAAIDLPFHGISQWPEDEVLQPAQLCRLLQQIKEHCRPNRLFVLGYSIGARLALAAAIHCGRFDGLMLVAPDGLVQHTWYNVAVYPKWGRYLFRHFIEQPALVFFLASLFRKLGLLSSSRYRILQQNADTAPKRRKVYQTWMCLSALNVTEGQLANSLARQFMSLKVLIGKYDRVLHRNRIRRIVGRLPHAELHMLACGHRVPDEEIIRELRLWFH
ncbi:MAG: alpha/beta fold hydrolase [Chitinophagales bacterium]|nr:alpha/beta fold hydrolase [Chitinophagales bacterium]MDW8428037.1 alpha/beta fold hydrolase [Chitinophagales bacterium]